jgi:chromosome segregation ATPase
MAHIRNVHLEGARWENCEYKALFEKKTSEKIEKIVLSRGFHAVFGNFLFSRGSAEESHFRIELSKSHITVITAQGTRTTPLAELELPEKRKAKLQRRTRAVIDTAQRIHARCVHTHPQGTESLSEGSTTDTDVAPRRERRRQRHRTSSSDTERPRWPRVRADIRPFNLDTETSSAPSEDERPLPSPQLPPLLRLPLPPSQEAATQHEETIRQQADHMQQLTVEIGQLQGELDVLQGKLEHSQDTQRTAAEALTERDTTIQRLKNGLSKLRATLEASEQQMMALTEEREQLFQRASGAEAQVRSDDKLEKALHEAQGQLEAQSSALAGLQQANDALTARANAATERTQQLEAALAAARETNAALQSDLTGSKAASAASGEALQAAQTALEEQRRIDAELKLQAGRVPQLESKLTAVQTELQSLREINLTLKDHTANALALSERATAVAEGTEERIALLKQELASVKRERDAMKSQLDKFSGLGEHSISQLTHANQALTRENASLVAKQEAMDKALAVAQRREVEAKETLERLRSTKADTDRLNQTQYVQLEELKQLPSQLAKAREEVELLRKENAASAEDSRNAIRELQDREAASESRIKDLEGQLRRARDRISIAENQLTTAETHTEREATYAKARSIWQETSRRLAQASQEIERLNRELKKQKGTPA